MEQLIPNTDSFPQQTFNLDAKILWYKEGHKVINGPSQSQQPSSPNTYTPAIVHDPPSASSLADRKSSQVGLIKMQMSVKILSKRVRRGDWEEREPWLPWIRWRTWSGVNQKWKECWENVMLTIKCAKLTQLGREESRTWNKSNAWQLVQDDCSEWGEGNGKCQ